MKIWQLPTPSLVADEAVMRQNMEAMGRLLEGKKLCLRPHYKSHKCSAIAVRQMALGAVGMTCAKLSEAEDLIFAGIGDVLIANQIVDPEKIRRAAELAGYCCLTVCVDDAENAKVLSEAAAHAGNTIHVLVEYEIGMNRCGVDDPCEYVRIAKAVRDLPKLEYEGIQAYAGHISHMIREEERRALIRANDGKLRQLISLLETENIPVRTISGGSTGTSVIKAGEGLYTELQAGSYLFMDSTYNKLGLPFRNSLFVLSQVVSRRDGLAILDAGVKSLGTDQDAPEVFRMDGTPVTGRFEANEEHLKIFGPSEDLARGEKLMIIPGHCCSTVNLYDTLYLCEDGEITNRLAVTGRGKCR